jgi:hypothetical protein
MEAYVSLLRASLCPALARGLPSHAPRSRALGLCAGAQEFMEEIVKAALDLNLGLFVTTPSKAFYPNPFAAALHEDSEFLFEFVGRILGKALYEGVTLDVPLAPFFVRRVLGGASSLDELPELDPQLHTSLLFVRAYEGDVSDLCLSFAIDIDRLGAQEQIELKPSGGSIAVDNANRIQVRQSARRRRARACGSAPRSLQPARLRALRPDAVH